MLFQGGKEVMRRPQVDKKGRAVSWSFTEVRLQWRQTLLLLELDNTSVVPINKGLSHDSD